MNSEKRVKQDNEITQEMMLDPAMPSRVIRSHRYVPTKFYLRFRLSLAGLVLLGMSLTLIGGAQPSPMQSGHLTSSTLSVPVPVPVQITVTPTTPPPVPVVPPAKPTEVAPVAVAPKVPVNTPATTAKPRGIETVIAFAMAQRGKRYVWGTAGPNTYDCSGLVLRAFAQVGIKLPHFTGAMISHGARVSRANMHRGDIVFPESGHVGIYLGNNMMIDAGGSGKVTVEKVYAFYAARRLI